MEDILFSSPAAPGILCLSHLAWDYVWQRPQHILSRLARHYPVLYVNEPVLGPPNSEPYLKLIDKKDNLTAWQPMFPDRPDVLENWRSLYVGLVQELLLHHGWARRNGQKLMNQQPLLLWFYTPIPYYFLDHISADLVVYDVMDELANFKNAARDMPAREDRLLTEADVVFAGGLSLYQARQGRHPNLHLFRSGVEAGHFARVLHPATEMADEVAGLPHPILGYYGVIDERIDLDLLQAIAAKHPEWSIVMVGPVTKIEQNGLPRLNNLHYLGKQPYERLPHFLKAFDVCLMPFQINEATRYISPTKTLEYMAAHKPIVSTPVPDVVTNWSDVVRIAAGPEEFARAIKTALAEPESQQAARKAREKKHLAAYSWDRIAAEMNRLIRASLQPATVRLMEEHNGRKA